MFRTAAILTYLLALAASCPTAHAQHPAGVAIHRYGTTCDFWAAPAPINGSYDPSTGVLTISVFAPQTCCNTWLTRQYLLVGVVPLSGFPLAAPFAPGCEVWVYPLTTGRHEGPATPWSLVMPPLPSGMHVYVQGVNEFFTTIGATYDLQATDGLDLTVL